MGSCRYVLVLVQSTTTLFLRLLIDTLILGFGETTKTKTNKKKRNSPSLPPSLPSQGYFTNEQIEALEVARREVPSSAPSYWSKIAARVPGQTPETCKAMVNQILLDKARGTGKQFFGGYVEVKETKMVVDTEATVGKRFKAAFGIK
eukprot:evm.model.NODE_36132_length_15106_cov_15.923143.2